MPTANSTNTNAIAETVYRYAVELRMEAKNSVNLITLQIRNDYEIGRYSQLSPRCKLAFAWAKLEAWNYAD